MQRKHRDSERDGKHADRRDAWARRLGGALKTDEVHVFLRCVGVTVAQPRDGRKYKPVSAPRCAGLTAFRCTGERPRQCSNPGHARDESMHSKPSDRRFRPPRDVSPGHTTETILTTGDLTTTQRGDLTLPAGCQSRVRRMCRRISRASWMSDRVISAAGIGGCNTPA